MKLTRLLALLFCVAVLAPGAAAADTTWSTVGRLNEYRYGAAAAALPDGGALVAGGDSPSGSGTLAGAERFSVTRRTWSPVAPMKSSRSFAATASLSDGRVLVAGGRSTAPQYLSTAELFDPVAGSWTSTGPMHAARSDAVATRLNDGRVLIVGGYGPTRATGARTGDLLTPRGEGSVMVNPSGGRPVMVGGFWWTNVDPVAGTWSTDSYERTIETYDAKAGAWTSGPRLAHGRAGHVAVVLDHDAILVAGGFGSGMDAELLADPTPTPTPAPTTTPTATASPSATAVPTGSPAPTPTPTATPASSRAKLLPLPKRVTLTRAGTLSIGVTCDGSGPCRDTLILKAGKSTLAKATFTLRRRGTINLRLSKTAVRKVARTGTKVTLELKDAHVVARGTLKRR